MQSGNAVATGSGGLGVHIHAVAFQHLAAPMVRHILAADADDGIQTVGRVDQQCPAPGAVATIGGLEVGRVGSGSRETVSVPQIRQFAGADGHRIGKGIDRLEVDRHLIHIVTTGLGVSHRIRVCAGGGDHDTVAPVVGFAGTKIVDGRILDDLGFIDIQSKTIDTVTALAREQGVVIDASCGKLATAPSVILVTTDGGFALEQIGRCALHRQGDDAVAGLRTGEDHRIGAGLGDGAVTVLDREGVVADIDMGDRSRVRVHKHRDHNRAVAALDRSKVQRHSASLCHSGLAIMVRQLVLADIHSVISSIGRIHRQVEGDHRVAAISAVEGDLVGATGIVAVASVDIRQLAVANRDIFRKLRECGDVEGHVQDAVTTGGGGHRNGLGLTVVGHREHRIADGIGHQTLADVQSDILTVSRVHLQVQIDDAVAIDGLRHKVHHIVARLVIDIAAPSIRNLVITDGDVGVLLINRGHRQIHGRDAVATGSGLLGGEQRVLAGLCGQRVETVSDITFALADGGVIDIVVRSIHAKVQRKDAVATGGGREGCRHVLRSSSSEVHTRAVIVHRRGGLTNRHRIEEMIDRMDIQGQMHRAVATRIHTLLLEVAGNGAHLRRRDVKAVLVVGLTQTDVGRDVGLLHLVDDQRQVDDAVAAGSGVEVVAVASGSIQCLSAEGVGQFIATKRHCAGEFIARQNGKLQCVDAVATGSRGEGCRHSLRARGRDIHTRAVIVHRCGGLANRLSLIEAINRIHGKHQMNRAVTTIFRGDDTVGVDDTGRTCHDGEVGVTIGHTGTDGSRTLGGIQIVHGKMQHGGAVATIGSVHSRLRVHTRGTGVETIECIGLALADVGVDDRLILSGHREVQGNHTVTAVCSGQGVVIGTCCIQDAAVEIVGSRLADGLVDGAAVNGVHRQGQGRGAVATIDVRALMHQRARAGRREEGVETIARITALGTNHSVVLDVVAMVDRQIQRHGAVATIHGLELLHICTTLGVGAVIPGVAVTSGDINRAYSRVVNGQMQGHGAVAAIDRLEMLHIVTGSRIGLRIPSVGVTSGGFDGLGHRRMNGQGQRHHAVASVGSNQLLLIDSGSGIGLVVPDIAVTTRIGELVGLVFLDVDSQGHHAVATIGGHRAERAGKVTGLGKGLLNAVIVVGRTLANGIADGLRLINRIDGQGQRSASVACTNDVTIVYYIRDVIMGGFRQLRSGVVRDSQRFTTFGSGIPLVSAGSRSVDGEGAGTAMGLGGELRQRRDGAHRGGHRLTTALTVRVGIVALHVEGAHWSGSVDGVLQTGFLNGGIGAVVQIPAAGGGIVVDSGRERDGTVAATNLILHNRIRRERIHRGHDRHTVGSAPGGGIGQLHIISMRFIQTGHIVGSRLANRSLVVHFGVPSIRVAVTALCREGDITRAATGSARQSGQRGLGVHGHVQGNGAVTTHCVRDNHRVIAGSSDLRAIEIKRHLIAATGDIDRGSGSVFHHDIDVGVTAAALGGGLYHITAGSRIVVAVKRQQVAHRSVNHRGVGIVDRKVQGHNAVATVHRMKRTGMGATLGEGLVVPFILVTNRLRFRNSVGREDRHRERIGNGRASRRGVVIVNCVSSGSRNIVRSGFASGKGTGLAIAVPFELATSVVALNSSCQGSIACTAEIFSRDDRLGGNGVHHHHDRILGTFADSIIESGVIGVGGGKVAQIISGLCKDIIINVPSQRIIVGIGSNGEGSAARAADGFHSIDLGSSRHRVDRHRQGNQRAAAVVAVRAGHIVGGSGCHALRGGVQGGVALRVAVPRQRVVAARRRQRHRGGTAAVKIRGRELVSVVVHRRHGIGHRGETAVPAQRAHVVSLRDGHIRAVGRARGRIGAVGVDESVGRVLAVEPVGRARRSGRQGYLARTATRVARRAQRRVGLVGHRHIGRLALAAVHHIGGGVGAGTGDVVEGELRDGLVVGVLPRQGVGVVGGGKGRAAAAGVDRGGDVRGVDRLTDGHRHSLGRAGADAVRCCHIVGGVGCHVHIHRCARAH